jgi:hypothetical protein
LSLSASNPVKVDPVIDILKQGVAVEVGGLAKVQVATVAILYGVVDGYPNEVEYLFAIKVE